MTARRNACVSGASIASANCRRSSGPKASGRPSETLRHAGGVAARGASFRRMNIFASSTDLERELGQRRRKLKDVSSESMALLEAADAREVRFYRAVRQVAFMVFVWPVVFALAALLASWAVSRFVS